MRASNLWRAARRLFVPNICALLAACGSGDGFVGSGGASGPLAPNFDSIQANVFEPICEHCHSGANAPVGLRLDAANSYSLLVGIASGERPNLLRVAPGDPNNSYLIQKLEGTAGIGERMPAGLPALPQADIDVIRQWIADGAQPSSSTSGPIRVTSVSPAPNSTVPALPTSITVGFNRDLNAPSVTTATFTLQRAGADAVLGTADDVAVAPASVTVPAANQRSAVMGLTGVAAVADRYRITLVGTGARGDSRPRRQRARRRADSVAALGRRRRRRQLHGHVHGGRHGADVDVDSDERVHAALLGLSQRRRCVLAGRHELDERDLELRRARRRREPRGADAAARRGRQSDNSYLIRKLEGGPNIVGEPHAARRPVPAANDDRCDSAVDHATARLSRRTS